VNKYEFLGELSERLGGLPESEKLEALRYFEEYFADAGPDNEQKVLKELGSPADMARQILKEHGAAPKSDQKSSWKEFWNSRLFGFGENGQESAWTLGKTPLETLRAVTVRCDLAEVELTPCDAFTIEYRMGGLSREPQWSVRDGLLEFRAGMRHGIVFGSWPWNSGDKNYLRIGYPVNTKLESLDIDVALGDVTVMQLASGSLLVKADKGNVSLDGIQASSADVRLALGNLSMKNTSLEKAALKLDCGNLDADQLLSQGAGVTMSLGRMSIRDCELSGRTALRNSSGSIHLDGVVTGELKTDNSLGNIDLAIDGRTEDYSCDLNVDLGSIRFNGLSRGTKVRQVAGSSNILNARNSCGNIDVRFRS